MQRIAYVLALVTLCLIAPIQASSVTILNETDMAANITQPANATPEIPANIPYIMQGETAYVGDYIDVSGVLPPYPQLAYWDGVDMYDRVPKYNLTMPDGKKAYYRFYLDPEIFSQRLGRWYKYDDKFEKQGNNLAFVVRMKPVKNVTMTFPNGTIVNLSYEKQVNYTPIEELIKPEPLLPERHEADYVAARGQPVVWPEGGYRLWIFGRVNGMYDLRNNTIQKEQVAALEPGSYAVAVHVPGNNTIFEASYGNNTLYPAFYGRKAVNVFGYNPALVLQNLKEMLRDTDDRIYEYKLVLDDPYITLNQADEVYHNGSPVLDIRGYTNVANGTKITVTLDEKKTVEYKDVTLAVRTSPGNLSYYRAYVPLDYDNLAADATNHTLIARTEVGGEVQKDFKISILPPDSFKPNATLKYIEDRNPFIPTPTPEIIKVPGPTQIVTQIVRVEVTPSNETVEAAQKKATEEVALKYSLIGAGITIFLLIIWFFGKYGISVYRRAKQP